MSKTARTDSFHILHTLVCCCFHLGIMALGLVRSTVELLTCGRGIIPPTHLSAALQIGSDVGVRSLCMEVD